MLTINAHSPIGEVVAVAQSVTDTCAANLTATDLTILELAFGHKLRLHLRGALYLSDDARDALQGGLNTVQSDSQARKENRLAELLLV